MSTLYVNYDSVKCMPVVLLCRMFDIDTINIIEYDKLCHKDNINPTLCIDNTIQIYGTISICRYICKTLLQQQQEEDSVYPCNNVLVCAQIDSMLERLNGMFFHLSSLSYAITLYHNDDNISAYHYQCVIPLLQRFQNECIPSQSSSSYPYLIQDHLTLVDIVIVCHVLYCNWIKCIDLTDFQLLIQWFDTITTSTNERLTSVFLKCCNDFKWFSVTSSLLYGRPQMLRLLEDPKLILLQKHERKTSILTENINYKWVGIVASDSLIDEVDGRYDGELYEYYNNNNDKCRVHRKMIDTFENGTRYHQISTMNLSMNHSAFLEDMLKDMTGLFRVLEPVALSNISILHDLAPNMKTVYISIDLKQESQDLSRGARFDFVLLHTWQFIPDGFIMLMTSLDDFQQKKGYVRSELINSGFIIRYKPDGHMSIHFNFDLRFPARVPNWISEQICTRSHDYLYRLAHLAANRQQQQKHVEAQSNSTSIKSCIS